MQITQLAELTTEISHYSTTAEYVIVKPNWISNVEGEFTEPEILDYVLQAFPNQKKIVIESYTPWRGLRYLQKNKKDQLIVSLEGGKNYWGFYKEQDTLFLRNTGIGEVLEKHSCKYINITNEYWSEECVNSEGLETTFNIDNEKIYWKELTNYVPKKLAALSSKSLFISLAKIKEQQRIKPIVASLSMKNLFGLIPHPSRFVPFHNDDHAHVYKAIKDMHSIYTSIFRETLWINEGIKTMMRRYREDDQEVVKGAGLLFTGNSAWDVDTQTCKALGLPPEKVLYLN